jgi:hypothetical protein
MEDFLLDQTHGQLWVQFVGRCAVIGIVGGMVIMLVAKVIAKMEGRLTIDTVGGQLGVAITLMGFLSLPLLLLKHPFRNDSLNLMLLDRLAGLGYLLMGGVMFLIFWLIRRWRKRVWEKLPPKKTSL